MPTDLAKRLEQSSGAREDTSVKGGKGTRAGVAAGNELKVSCNADGIGYEWKPKELYLISNSCIITAFMQKEGDKSDY